MAITDDIEYCPETGTFRWKVAYARCVKVGKIAGSKTRDGYWIIFHRGVRYPAHHVAWFFMTGVWPKRIDHKNLVKDDNRWTNLREATPAQNNANWRAQGAYGKGVTFHSGGKYQAQIKVQGRNHYLGLFETPELANAAYATAAKNYYGEFARAA